jgi:isopenicillin N synthase-like dioxygenase
VKQSIAAEVGRGVSDIGFLVITGHGVDPGLIAQVQAISKAFFDLPLEEKLQVARPAPDVTRGQARVHTGMVGEVTPGPIRYAISCRQRTEFGRPAASIRFRTVTPMAASVCWAGRPRARSRGPISALYQPIVVSTSERRR